MAELALGSMFSLARRLPMMHQVVVSGGWQRHVGTEIEGKTLGIVGLGSIGKILAVKARALGMGVLAADLRPDTAFAQANGIELLPLDALLPRSDFVSLHVFGGKENQRLIGARQFGRMKPTAYLMNFARGEVLDLDALGEALERGQILGAATTESVERMGLMNVGDIDRVLSGARSPRVLNPQVYDGRAFPLTDEKQGPGRKRPGPCFVPNTDGRMAVHRLPS